MGKLSITKIKRSYWLGGIAAFLLGILFWWPPPSVRVSGTLPKDGRLLFVTSYSSSMPIPLLCQDFSFGSWSWIQGTRLMRVTTEADPLTGEYSAEIPLGKRSFLCGWETDGIIEVNWLPQEEQRGSGTMIYIKPAKFETFEQNIHTIQCKKISSYKSDIFYDIFCRGDATVAADAFLTNNTPMIEYSSRNSALHINFDVDPKVYYLDFSPRWGDVWGGKLQ